MTDRRLPGGLSDASRAVEGEGLTDRAAFSQRWRFHWPHPISPQQPSTSQSQRLIWGSGEVKHQITCFPHWFWLRLSFSQASLFPHLMQLTNPCPAPSNLHSAPRMALQDVCNWQAPDSQGPSPHLPQAGDWAVPRGCDLEAFLQIHGPKLAHGTTTLAFRFCHGVIAAADTRSSCGNYVACPASRKVIPVHQHLLGTTSGTSADCVTWYRVLQRELRLRELREGQLPSVASAAKLLSAMMSRYRGLDLCVATALCGWDHSGPALFYVYSNGTRLQGDIFSVGSGSPYAYSVLDQGYRYDMTTQEAYALARRAVAYATHRDAYSGGSVDLFHVRESGWEYVSRNDACILYVELREPPELEEASKALS